MAATMMATPTTSRSWQRPSCPFFSLLVAVFLGRLSALLGQEPGEGQAVPGHVESGRTRELAGANEVRHAVEGAGELHSVVEDVIDVPLDLEDGPEHPVE